MNLDFTKGQDMVRKSVADFFKKECPFDQVKELEESDLGYSPEMWKKMAELGWMQTFFPEEYGGFGDSFMDLVIIIEEMGKAAFPSPFYSTVVQCGITILDGGSEEQKRELLTKIGEGELVMALALYEEEASYLYTGIKMPARHANNQYVLDGVKMFVKDACVADKLIVAARTEDNGVTLFLVDADAPGVTSTKMPTIGMDNTCRVVFENVNVSEKDIIGTPGEGEKILEKMVPKATVAKCAEMLGGCKVSIDMAADYAKKRYQYGIPIGGFQAIQHYMANMLLVYDPCFNYLYQAAWKIDEGLDVSQEASVLKAQVNEAYKFITEKSIQVHGGVGTTREFNIGLFYRRAKAAEFIQGDTDHHYEIIAQSLGM